MSKICSDCETRAIEFNCINCAHLIDKLLRHPSLPIPPHFRCSVPGCNEVGTDLLMPRDGVSRRFCQKHTHELVSQLDAQHGVHV